MVLDKGSDVLENLDTERGATILQLTPFRLICLVFGGVLVGISFMADQLGFGQPGSFGGGQVMLALAGLVMILIGVIGQRIVELYRWIAIIVLNTFVLVAIMELVAIVVARSGVIPSYRQEVFAAYQDLPYYASQDWTEVYWREATQAENYRYEPHIIWRHLPFEGQTINIDEEGIRETPGADCGPEAYKVFAFGGSTMWGWGSPDWGTIPAYLQDGLEEDIEGSVCVINFGEDGFVSTQSLVSLVLQLQSENVPDLVVFYSGVNDVYAAYETGEAGKPVTLSEISARFQDREHPLIQWIKASRLYALAEGLILKRQPAIQSSHNPIDTNQLAVSVTEVYLNNYDIVAALGQVYGFEYYFFWQPHLAVGNKPLTPAERTINSRADAAIGALANTVYQNISLVSQNYEHLRNLANIFDIEKEQLWIDEWGHITPEGNRLVAQKMLESLRNSLTDK